MCWGYHSTGNLGRGTIWSTTATNQFTDPLRICFCSTTSLNQERNRFTLTLFSDCCIQYYIMVYEGRTTCCFFHNLIKHHAQLFLQNTLLTVVLSSKNQGIDIILMVCCICYCISVLHLFLTFSSSFLPIRQTT